MHPADRRGLSCGVHKQPAGSEPVPTPTPSPPLSSVLTPQLWRYLCVLMRRCHLLPSRVFPSCYRSRPVPCWADCVPTGSRGEKPSTWFPELYQGLPCYLLFSFFFLNLHLRSAWISHRFHLEAFSVERGAGLATAAGVEESVTGRICEGGFSLSKGESA